MDTKRKGKKGFQKGNKYAFKKGNKLGGRLPRAEELGLNKLIDKATGPKGMAAIIAVLVKESLAGSYKHMELLLHYYYGKPTEKIKVDYNKVPESVSPAIQIIADTLKLEKLKQDKIDAAENNIDVTVPIVVKK